MPLPSFDALFTQADRLQQPVRVVAAGGADATVIQALELARRRGWVEPILTGPRTHIAELAASLDIDIEPFRIVEDASDSARAAVGLVRRGEAAMLMKGQLSTPSLMKAVLDRDQGLRTGQTIAQVVLMEIVRDQRSFLMADTGVTIEPTLSQKEQILQSMAAIAQKLGVAQPRIAVMSATEKATEAMPDTLEASELAQRGAQGAYGACVVEGPLSFDLAYAPDAVAKKQVSSAVAGEADGMLFPNLLAGNLTVKGIMYTADCRFGGVLAGTACPVVFMSRSDTVETRLRSLAYAMGLLET